MNFSFHTQSDKTNSPQKGSQEFLDDPEELKLDLINNAEQDQIMQLQDELNVKLKKLEINDTSQIQPKIQEVLNEIENFEKTGSQIIVQEKQQFLQNLNASENILTELQDLKNKTGKVQNQKQEEQLQKQLNLLLEELEIQEIEETSQQIEETKQQIEKCLLRNQQKNASGFKIRHEDKLNEILLDLELKDENQIESEIEETQDDIAKLEKKGQKKKVAEKKQILEKLKNAQKILNELKDLVKQVENISNQSQEELLQNQLNLLLEDLDIQDTNQIPQEIEDVKLEIQKLIEKNQQKKASDSQIILDKLIDAQQKSQELLKLKGQAQSDQTVVQKKNQIESEIEETQDDNAKLEKKGQKKKVAEKKQILEKLKNAQKILNELKDLVKQAENISNQSQEELLQNQLNLLLEDLNIQDTKQIPQEIEDVQIEIQKLIEKNQQKNTFEFKIKLEKLQDAQKKYYELLKLKEETPTDQRMVNQKQIKDKSKVVEKKQTLEKLKNVQKSVKKLKDLEIQAGNPQNERQEKQLKSQQDTLPIELDIKDVKQISEEIQEQKDHIQKCKIENSRNLYQSKPINQMKKFNLDDIKEDISLIPESSEKYLLEMLEISLNLLQQKSIPQTDQGGQQLLSQIEKIQKRFQIEDEVTPEITLSIQKIKMNIDQVNFEALVDQIDMLIKKVRPLNINEMKRLIQEADNTAQKIEGQDIILLLGGTGAGKSTTIHFLAGSKMVEEKIEIQQGEFLQYIAPNEIKNEDLNKIKVGFQAKSETRFITPVNINFRDINMGYNGSIILCDSPGFDDTAGPEVDIANGLGIVQAVKLCKSVRPVILLSFKSMGDRGQGIKQLAHILVRLVEDIQDNLSSFSYLFSNFPEKFDISPQLINIRNSLDQNTEEKYDKAFFSLFDDMINKTKKSCNKIDPLNGNPSKILKVLIKEEGIQDPSQVFKFSITANSYSAITGFTLKTQQTIISALKRSEYNLIEYKLDEIKFLLDILNQDSTKQTYKSCTNQIKEAINKDYENATGQLTQQIQNQNKLDSNFLRQYQELIQKFSSIQDLRIKHLGTDVISADDLLQELKLAVKNLAEVFDNEVVNQTTVVNLDNIKLVSEYFPKVVQQYQEACSKVQNQIEKTINSCKQALSIKNFDELSQTICQVKQYLNKFQNHLDNKPILVEIEKIKDIFKKIIDQAVQEANEILKQQQLKDQDISIINEQISIIERAQNNYLLSQHIDIDYVNTQNENLFKIFYEHFEKISKVIEEILRKEPDQAFSQLEVLINQMKQLRKIKGLESKTANIYHKYILGIQALMQQIKKDVEQILSDFQCDKKKVDFLKISRSLKKLKYAQWMNNENEGAYDQIQKQISQELFQYSQSEIVLKLGEIDLSYKNFRNIQIASEFIKELEAMIHLEECNFEE
ncbi:hypothetical protein ABPG72_022442 [Tetrahymena utriculariae]